MRVLVSDTSILIDLERASLLRAAFSLEAEFVVPDLLYERELRDSGGADLVALGLRVESLDESEVEHAQAYRLSGQGKRGGVRVICVRRLSEQKIWLLFMYSKAVQADVERKLLKKLRETIDG